MSGIGKRCYLTAKNLNDLVFVLLLQFKRSFHMTKILSIIIATMFLSQPLLAAGGYSSGTSSATKTNADPFAAVYQLIEVKKFAEAHSALKLLNVPSKQADKFNLLGFTARKSGDFASAAAYYEQALSIDPKHLRALEYQGELYIKLGQFSEAEENLKKIQKICWLPCNEEKLLSEAIELAMKN